MSKCGTFPANGVASTFQRHNSADTRNSPTAPVSLFSQPVAFLMLLPPKTPKGAKAEAAAPLKSYNLTELRPAKARLLQRQVANPLASDSSDRIGHRRQNRRHGGFPNSGRRIIR